MVAFSVAPKRQTDVRYFLSEEAAAGRESLLTAVGSQIFLAEVRYFSRKSDISRGCQILLAKLTVTCFSIINARSGPPVISLFINEIT